MTCCGTGGSGPIWMSHLDCFGDEETVAGCNHGDGMGTNTCTHADDIYLECVESAMTLTPLPTSTTTTRLTTTQPPLSTTQITLGTSC